MIYRILKSALPLFLTLSLTTVLLSSSGNTEQTELIFKDKLNRVQFRYSDQFVIEPVALPEVVVALKSKTGGLPSFNIVSIAERYTPESLTPDTFEERILSDYRKVGYTEALVIGTEPVRVAGQGVLSTEIRFQTNNGALSAHVTLLPSGQNSHLILTYMNRVDVANLGKDAYRDIINSLELPNYKPVATAAQTDGGTERRNYWTTFAILVGLGIVVGLASRILRARSKSP